MPKSKVDHAQAVRDVKTAWLSRGYRADYLIAHQYDRDGDEGGELAYQRAFAEAITKSPPRLPNPNHYPNSTSALAFIQRQNAQFFNNSQASAMSSPKYEYNSKYESPILDMYWKGQSQDATQRSASSTPPTTHVQSGSVTPQIKSEYVQTNGLGQQVSPTTNTRMPLTMEPRMGAPMGPPSRLR